MASRTICGCVNRTTGAITFEGEACNSSDYTGCIERTGEHAGQVKVVIDDSQCDDTYYGCVDRATGQFRLEIPYCCYGDDCLWCFDAGLTPKVVVATFSGVQLCSGRSWPGGISLNGEWLLEQAAEVPCMWEYIDENYRLFFVAFIFEATTFRVRENINGAGDWYFRVEPYQEPPCQNSLSSTTEAGDCNGLYAAHGGSVSVSPF